MGVARGRTAATSRTITDHVTGEGTPRQVLAFAPVCYGSRLDATNGPVCNQKGTAMKPSAGNLFTNLPAQPPADELFEVLTQRPGWKIERITSWGHATPQCEWFDQTTDEWVVLLAGAARLRIEGELVPRELGAGDWVFLPARLRHRVEWTDETRPTIWLAFHIVPEATKGL